MKTLKELRAVILVLGVYLIFGCYLWAGNYANMRLERTYEIKYRYMMMVTMVIFWLAAAAAIALLGGIMKKRFLWVEICPDRYTSGADAFWHRSCTLQFRIANVGGGIFR